jgi:hypothetical protein
MMLICILGKRLQVYINRIVFNYLARKFELDEETIISLDKLRLAAPDMLITAEPRFNYMDSREGMLTLLHQRFDLAEQEYSSIGNIFPSSIESLESKPALFWLYNFPAKLNYIFKKELLKKENYIFIREHESSEGTASERYLYRHPLFMRLQAEQVTLTTRMLNSTVKYETRILNEVLQSYSLIVERRLKDLQSGFEMSETPGEYEVNYWTSCYDAFSDCLIQ